MTKELGYISSAEFGSVPDYEFLFGLQLAIVISGGMVASYNLTTNLSEQCKDFEPANKRMSENCRKIKQLLDDAQVNTVDQLVGVPVEVVNENMQLKDFRILTEVIPKE